MNRNYIFFIVLLTFLYEGFRAQASPTLQDDSLSIYELIELPKIDGDGSDKCWENISWQSISMVWIPWNGSVTENDYTGKYKVAWSSSTNLLYFLVQVTDDVIVDHYQPDGKNAVHQFDIIEVFIDENRSKGKHVFDTPTENAENAFGYHMWTKFPDSGMVSKNYRVQDLAGKNWNDMISIVYTEHFPELALKEKNKVFTWEFSMKVFNDTYDHKNPEQSRVKLSKDKLMGLSVAYCDNDSVNESPVLRDNFYGSVYVPSNANNSHWEDAEYFGAAKLKGPQQVAAINTRKDLSEGVSIYGGNAGNGICYSFTHSFTGILNVSILNLSGMEVSKYTELKGGSVHQGMLPSKLERGCYLLKIAAGKEVFAVEKFIVCSY